MKPITFSDGGKTQVRTEDDIRLMYSSHPVVTELIYRINELEREAPRPVLSVPGVGTCASCRWMLDPGVPMCDPVCVRYPPSASNPGEHKFPSVIPHVHFCGEWKQR